MGYLNDSALIEKLVEYKLHPGFHIICVVNKPFFFKKQSYHCT